MTTKYWQNLAENADLHIKNYVDGKFIDTKGEYSITKYSPRNGELLYKFRSGLAADVDCAVASSRRAFNDGYWSRVSVHQRKLVLQKLADLIIENKEQLALLDCLDVGKPISSALNNDVPLAATTLESCAEGADKLVSSSNTNGRTTAYQLRKPVGVVGAVIGWNFPLWMAAIKAGPALAMGNSLVLKPSEFSSLSAGRLAALAVEAGLPPGVFNVVHGAGETVGDSLACHPDIDLISFTGSTATGKQMMMSAGQSNMKRLMLECGGKSPYIVFDDCPKDLDFIAADVVETAFHNQGEWCSAGSRLLIQESIKDALLPKIVERAAQLKPRDPLDPDTDFGALINESHMDKVLGFIESGKREGAELILGGHRVVVDTDGIELSGCYLEPTIFDNVDPQHQIAQREIFGPVLSVLTFRDEAEAIKLANNTCYGLAAYVATESLGRAQRLAQAINCGYLAVVGSSVPPEGGVEIGSEAHRQSGFGCESGLNGLASYTVSTAVHLMT